MEEYHVGIYQSCKVIRVLPGEVHVDVKHVPVTNRFFYDEGGKLLPKYYGIQRYSDVSKDIRPRLGYATTAELIDEIRARCEVDGTLNYKTVGE